MILILLNDPVIWASPVNGNAPPPAFKACEDVNAYELLIITSYMLPLASLYLGILSEVSLKYVLELTKVCPAEDVTYCWYGIPIEAVILFMLMP